MSERSQTQIVNNRKRVPKFVRALKEVQVEAGEGSIALMDPSLVVTAVADK